MKRIKKNCTLVFFGMFYVQNTFSYTSTDFPNGAIFLNSKAYLLSISEYLFQTKSQFDFQGHENTLSDSSSFVLSDTRLKIEYGIDYNFSVLLGANIRRLAASEMVQDTPQNLTKLGLESATIGIKYQLQSLGNKYFAIGARYFQTLYTNTKYDYPSTAPSDELSLGDDGKGYSLDFYTTFLYPKNRVDALLSYTSPPNNLSQEIDYQLELHHRFDKFSVLCGIDGILSLKKDPYATDPNLKPKISTSVTSLFNSTNREYMSAYVGGTYDFSKFRLVGKAGNTMTGVSTDKGQFVFLSFEMATKGISREFVKIDEFKEYHLEASVLKVSARGNYVKIDQGLSTDVEKGMQFDIYQTDYFGGNVLVASGIVFEIKADSAIIKLVKKYADIEIRPGFAARAK